MNNMETKKAQSVDVWVAIFVLGSLWGFSEVVLSGALTAAGLPYRSAILTGIGVGLMAIAVSAYRKPLMLAGIAAVAILCKQLVVPILHASVLCKANSCLAVLLEGMALVGTVTIVGRALQRSSLARVASGAGAALLAAATFHYLGIRLAPCQYLLTFNRPGGLLTFMVAEGVPWAVSSALLFPVGYRIGLWFKESAPALRAHKPLVYYAANAAVIVSCWLASALAIVAGF